MSTTTAHKATYDDYARLPEGAPYQLINGELIREPSPSPYHQRISQSLEIALILYLQKHPIGEIMHAPLDVFLSDHETYQPDIIFIANDRLDIIGEKRIEGAPDLVMEILSPSTAYYDLRHKRRVYEASQVKEYWIVDPMQRSIEVYRNTTDGFVPAGQSMGADDAVSTVLPGFAVSAERIFR